MTTTGPGQFSAVDATLGYLYQVRSALLWALRRQKSEPDFLVSIETLDDVTFETMGGAPTDLLQTKHHRARSASLTDASSDLWKTLRIWFEGNPSPQTPLTANLYLVTTSLAPDGSAASRLRATGRDVPAAQHALDATAATSTNKANRIAYAAYLNASAGARTAILGRVFVIDAAPTIVDLDLALRDEVFWAAGREHHAAFLDRLEGWWLRRVLRQLTAATQDRIGSVEIEAQMADLREQFKADALPIDDDILAFTLDDAQLAAHTESTFVKQLDIIKAGKRRVAAAVRDYYKAFEQRSRWVREDLVVGMDLHKYEQRLCQEWELVFEAMCDDVGVDATEQAQEQAARTVLAWAERTSIPIRPSVTEPFVTRGSFHMLADEARIGWHREFRARLGALLSAKGSTA